MAAVWRDQPLHRAVVQTRRFDRRLAWSPRVIFFVQRHTDAIDAMAGVWRDQPLHRAVVQTRRFDRRPAGHGSTSDHHFSEKLCCQEKHCVSEQSAAKALVGGRACSALEVPCGACGEASERQTSTTPCACAQTKTTVTENSGAFTHRRHAPLAHVTLESDMLGVKDPLRTNLLGQPTSVTPLLPELGNATGHPLLSPPVALLSRVTVRRASSSPVTVAPLVSQLSQILLATPWSKH